MKIRRKAASEWYGDNPAEEVVMADVPEVVRVLAVVPEPTVVVASVVNNGSVESAPKGEEPQMLKPGTIMPVTQQKLDALTEAVKKDPESWSYDKADAWLKSKFGTGMDYTRIGIILRDAKGIPHIQQRPPKTERVKNLLSQHKDAPLHQLLPSIVGAMKKVDAVEVTVRRDKNGEYRLSYDVEAVVIKTRHGTAKYKP